MDSPLPNDVGVEHVRLKYGLFVHYVWGGTETGLPGALAPRKDGTRPYATVDEMTRDFPVDSFANDVASMGVEYLIFTAWHYDMNPLYPSAVMNRWMAGLPKKTSDRDVIRELIAVLKPKGIRLYLYIHPNDGHDFTAVEKLQVGYDDPTDSFRKYNDFMNDMYGEVCERYQDYVSGFWSDENCGDKGKKIDAVRLRRTLRSHDAKALSLSNFTPPLADILSWEVFPIGQKTCPAEPFRSADIKANNVNTWPCQPDHIAIVFGGNWMPDQPHGKTSASFPAETLFRYTILQAGANTKGMGVAWAAGPYADGGWETHVKENMVKAGRYLAPIARSVKGVLASTSYPTAPGSTIDGLIWGVATMSVDGSEEYIHVLKPPSGPELILPLPMDGKVFTSAKMLVSGRNVTLTKVDMSLELRIPERWDPLDTVIVMTVAGTLRDNLAGQRE